MENIVPMAFLKADVTDNKNGDEIIFENGASFMNFFTSEDASKVEMPIEDTSSKKKPRKKKVVDEDPVVGAAIVSPSVSTNTPYIDTYSETNNMLRAAIAQTDKLSADVASDIDNIRNSKTIKSKYTYLTNLTGSASALIGSKIQAIREINSSITQSHNLELKRMSMNKASAEAEKNDDMRIMQMYDAFVNAPIGTYNNENAAYLNTTMQSLTTAIPDGNPMLTRVNIDSADAGFNNYMNNLTPEQNRMMMETNPNIKTVVKYNPEDGSRYFDVIDVTNGQSVPNIARPGDFLLQDTMIDVHNQIARNRNVDKTWPLIIIGGSSNIMEY